MIVPKKWEGFRSVLCPIDFSEHSQQALRYAETIALRGKAELRVVYVNDPLLVAAAAAALHDRQLARRSAHELQAFINATIASSRTQQRVKSHVSIGNPPDEILKAANTGRTDLIVLGTHGLTGANRLFMGSTTLSVLQRTTVPVLAVPRGGESPTAPVPSSWPGEQIVAAIELDGKSADDEVDIAAHIAQWFGSSLLLAHVLSEIATPAWLTADLSAHDRIRIAHVQRRLDALAARAHRRVEIAVRVVCGKIADEIAALAATERTGLLLTALHDRRVWFGARRGSISYHVLSHAVTPVLAYPPQWRPR